MKARNGRAGNHETRQVYRCFLLRCRLEEGAGPNREPNGSGAPAWRFTVQQASPEAAHRSFASLKDVAAYLEAELAPAVGCAGEPEEVIRRPEWITTNGTD